MRKLWLIIKREYLTRVRTRGFILTTLALPLVTVGMLALEAYSTDRGTDHTLKLTIIDNAGGLGTSIASKLTDKLPSGRPAFQVVGVLQHPTASQEQEVRAQVEHGQVDAFLTVPAGITRTRRPSGGAADGSPEKDPVSVELHARNTAQATLGHGLRDAVSDAVITERLREHGIKVDDSVSDVVQGVDIKLIKVSEKGEAEEKGQTFITALLVGMVLYLTVLVYGVNTMRSVIEEKSSRVMELLVASVRPVYLLTGKIVGVAAVGLTQYLIWGVLGSAATAVVLAMASAGKPAPTLHVPWVMGTYMVVFFLCGYFLYAALYAAVGAMVSSDQEGQQVQMPITFLIVGAFFMFSVILREPGSHTAIILSMIPFFSPILMVLRIALQTPPFWQIALSIGISLATSAGVIYLAARIYRVGVLMYGKRPSLVELARWIKYS